MQYSLKKVKALCPLCGAKDSLLLYELSPEDVAASFFVKERYPERYNGVVRNLRKLWKGGNCQKLRCVKCSLCYAYPFVAGDSEFYNLIFGKVGNPPWVWEFEITIKELKKIIKEHGNNNLRLLEIGPGPGRFIREAVKQILPKNALCVEYSKVCRDEIEKQGIKCECGDIRDMDLKKMGKFQIICMFSVFEHLDRLDEFFAALGKLAADDTVLFIVVPNPAYFELCEQKGATLEVPPHHVTRWNRKCFEYLCKKYNLILLDYETEPSSSLQVFKRFIFAKYKRSRESNTTFAYRVASVKNLYLRRFFEIFLLSAYVLGSLHLIFSIPGGNVWVHLRKSAK